jgi:signal transduction histidine kinase
MKRDAGPLDGDTRAVRRVSRAVGLQLTIASAAVVVLAILAAIFFVLDQLQPSELLEKPRPGEDKIYVDAGDMMTALIVVGVLAVVLSGVIGWWVARRAVRPIAEALRVQRTFVADASHELRTPLAVLDARLQVLQRGLAADDPSTEPVAELRRDTWTLVEIVNDLLLAADTSGGARDTTEAVALAPLIERSIDDLRTLGEPRGLIVEFAASGAGELRAQISAISYQRCVVALVDNALVHSPDGSRVQVALGVEHGMAVLTVRDHGSGIRGIEPSRIFDRFAHGTATDAQPDGRRTGFGIGLALVRDVAVRAGGWVDVRESSADGTVIALGVPTA